MRLKEFISEALVAVGEALNESAEPLRALGVDVLPAEQAAGGEGRRTAVIRFDLAIAATPATETNGNSEIHVLDASGGTEAPVVSRIRFAVPMAIARGPVKAGESLPTDLEWE